MAELLVELTEEQGAFISNLVEGGEYADAGAVLRQALAKMQVEDDLKLTALRKALQEGIDSGIYGRRRLCGRVQGDGLGAAGLVAGYMLSPAAQKDLLEIAS